MKALVALSISGLLLVACQGTDDPPADAGTPNDASTPRDTGVATDAGLGNDASPEADAMVDGGTADAAEPRDAAPSDGGPSSPVLVSSDVLVRPSRMSADGRWLAYFEGYSEQANELATNGQLHFFETATRVDHQVASNVSPLSYQISDDWARALYFSRVDTTAYTARAFTYDRVAGSSTMIAEAAFFHGLLGRDGITAVVSEHWDLNDDTGEILQVMLASGAVTSRTTNGSLVYRHDLSRWYLYFDRNDDTLHISGFGDVALAAAVDDASIVVSDDNLYIAYVRAVGASGGTLELSDAAGTTSTVAANVRPGSLNISGHGESIIYGTGGALDPTMDLYRVLRGGVPEPIAMGVVPGSVVIAPSHEAVVWARGTAPGVGDLHVWTAAGGDQLVASAVPTTRPAILADDGSVVAYFASLVSGQPAGQLVRWTSAGTRTLGDGVSLSAIAHTSNLERIAFVRAVDPAGVGELVIDREGMTAVMIASGVAATQTPAGASTGYYVSDALDQAVAFVSGATPSIGELHGWREGGTPGVIGSGVPAGSWRLTPDRQGLVFLADFVDEPSGADHGTLQAASSAAPIPHPVHTSAGRYFTVSDRNVAYVAVHSSAPGDDGLYVAPLP